MRRLLEIYDIIVITLKCLWNKYPTNEIMKTTSSSGIYKDMYINGSFLFLF